MITYGSVSYIKQIEVNLEILSKMVKITEFESVILTILDSISTLTSIYFKVGHNPTCNASTR